MTVGCSLGAFHAANIALRHAHVFPRALCLSGSYDPAEWHAWGDRGDASYFHNPMEYVANLHGDHLDWLRHTVHLTLVVGQGAWEVDPTRALPSTRAFAGVLADKGIPHDLDVWGHDVPHDWESWRRQVAHHLPRFCWTGAPETADGPTDGPADGAAPAPRAAVAASASRGPR